MEAVHFTSLQKSVEKHNLEFSGFALQLQRAWGSLRWDERIRFAMTLLQGMSAKNLDASEECLEVFVLSLSIQSYQVTSQTSRSIYQH